MARLRAMDQIDSIFTPGSVQFSLTYAHTFTALRLTSPTKTSIPELFGITSITMTTVHVISLSLGDIAASSSVNGIAPASGEPQIVVSSSWPSVEAGDGLSPTAATATAPSTSTSSAHGLAAETTAGIAVTITFVVTYVAFLVAFHFLPRQRESHDAERKNMDSPLACTGTDHVGKAELEDAEYTRSLDRLHAESKPELQGTTVRVEGEKGEA